MMSDPPRSPRRQRWRVRLRRALPWVAGGYLLAAVVATHVPLPRGTGQGVPHMDKAVHFGIFFGLCLLAAAWRVTRFDRPRRAALTAVGLCLLYGAADELSQALLPSRSADPYDLLADAAGAVAGAAAFFPLLRRWRRSHRRGQAAPAGAGSAGAVSAGASS